MSAPYSEAQLPPDLKPLPESFWRVQYENSFTAVKPGGFRSECSYSLRTLYKYINKMQVERHLKGDMFTGFDSTPFVSVYDNEGE